MVRPFEAADVRYAGLGIDFIVLKVEHGMKGVAPVFENSRFVVYVVQADSLPAGRRR